jgi:hypothetical protein
MGPMPYGITWSLMLLKVLHKPPRPIRIFNFSYPIHKGKRDNNHNNVVNNEIRTWGILKDPISYGIT